MISREDIHPGATVSAPRWLLPAVLLLALAGRLPGLNFSLWLDESASLAFTRQPLSHLWGEWMLRETNPPLFYTLLKGWRALAGSGEEVARLLPVGIGVVGVWGMYLLGRAVGGERAGLLAAALLALSAIHVDYSIQLRGYGLAYAGVVFACLGMVRFLQQRSTRWLALYVGSAAIALYGHTTLAIFVGLANAAMLWLLRRDLRAAVHWLGANILLALLWSWWAWITIRQLAMPHNFSWIEAPTIVSGWRTASVALVPLYLRSETLAGGALLAAMLAAALIVALRCKRPETSLLAVLALGAPLLMFAISLKTPILLPRTLLWASAPLLVLIAVGVVGLEPMMRRAAGGLLLLLSGFGLAIWYPDGEQERWAEAARTIDREAGERSVWVADSAVALALAQYLPDAERRVVVVERPRAPHERWALGLFAGRSVSDVAALREFVANCSIVVVSRGDYDPNRLLRGRGWRETAIGQQERNPRLTQWDCGPGHAVR